MSQIRERREGDHRLYLAEALAVRIVPQPCSDGMSDRRYVDSVVVRIGNGPEHLNGCGGAVMPMTGGSLERSSWRITAIDGRAAIAEVEADISFADGRVTGTAGCNRLAGSYRQQRNALTIGGIAATRMACPGPRGAQETAVLAVLNQPMTVTWGPRMTMTLTAADGKRIDLRRLDWD